MDRGDSSSGAPEVCWKPGNTVNMENYQLEVERMGLCHLMGVSVLLLL